MIAASEPIVHIQNLRKVYDNGTEALKSVTLDIQRGEVFGIIGVNGAGKTTLIRIITTMLKATSGLIEVGGIDPAKDPEGVRQLVGALPQETGLYEEMTVKENLEFIAKMQGIAKDNIKFQVDKITQLMGIQSRQNDRVANLSGGLKQRAMIARALIGNPQILFLDEPTTGLDVLVARTVRKTIQQLSLEKTIFLATHNMYEAYQLCSRVAILSNGSIMEVDTPQNILQKYRKDDEDFEDVIASIIGLENEEEST